MTEQYLEYKSNVEINLYEELIDMNKDKWLCQITGGPNNAVQRQC